MNSGVCSKIKTLDGSIDDRWRSVSTDDGDDGSVVIGIAMHVEKIAASGARDLLNKVKVAAFADIDDALNHDGSRTRSCPIQLREVEMNGAGRGWQSNAVAALDTRWGINQTLSKWLGVRRPFSIRRRWRSEVPPHTPWSMRLSRA